MRIIRLKINPAVREVLSSVSNEVKAGDGGLTEDIFSLLRLHGNGIPDQDRIAKMADFAALKTGTNSLNVRIMMNRRAAFLKQISKMAYFRALSESSDAVNSTRRIFLTFQKLYLKYREAQCLTCQYLTACDFGKQYANATTDIGKVVDPDFSNKVHADCPVLPQVSAINQIAEAMAQWKKMVSAQEAEAQVAKINMGAADEDEKEAEFAEIDSDTDSGNLSFDEEEDDTVYFPEADVKGSPRRRSKYSGSHDGSQYVRQFETMVEQLNKTQLVIFSLGQKFGYALNKDKKGKFKPTEVMSKDRDKSKIRSEVDIPRLVPSEHALPSSVFNERLGKKALNKQQEMEPSKRKRILYLLVDNSGSMKSILSQNKYGMLTRGALATVFSLTLTRQVRDEGGIVFCRFFAGSAGYKLEARTKDEFEPLLQMMTNASWNGGSTNIPAAVFAAMSDIKDAKKTEDISKSEVLLITDCQDSFDAATILNELGPQGMNILDVSGTAKAFEYEGSRVLHKVAKAYYRVDPSNIDITKIVSLV